MKINCIQCNAPLQILGNGLRSNSLVCQYCGTVMDMRNDFKALYSFATNQKDSKFRIGQKHSFQNIEYKIVGFITYQSQPNQWIEYQLYSITHGYAKLIEKDGKAQYYRRTHYLPKPNIWLLTNKDVFIIKGQKFTIQSFEFAEVYYAAGNILDDISSKKRRKQCFARCGNKWFYSTFQRDSVKCYLGFER